MTSVPLLAVHPFPLPPAVEEVTKQAFISLNLPHPVRVVGAVLGGPYRVLALGSIPPWVCDCAPVVDPANVDSVRNAILWVLTAPEGDDSGWMTLDYLKAAFGSETREIESEGVEQKVRFE